MRIQRTVGFLKAWSWLCLLGLWSEEAVQLEGQCPVLQSRVQPGSRAPQLARWRRTGGKQTLQGGATFGSVSRNSDAPGLQVSLAGWAEGARGREERWLVFRDIFTIAWQLQGSFNLCFNISFCLLACIV